MNEQMIAILGGLIGSILTVLISKIIDIIQKRDEFEFELKKEFFIRKLVATEKAMIRYSLISEAMGLVAVLHEGSKTSQTPVGENLSSTLGKQIEEKMRLAEDSSLVLSRSISLYFDFESQSTFSEKLSKSNKELSKLNLFISNKEIALDKYIKSKVTFK